MKKTNWINYTLIVALLFIWAGVGYSIYAAYSGDEYQIKNLKKIVKVNSTPIDTSANYVLSLNYPDPFTKKVYSSHSVGKSLYSSLDDGKKKSVNHHVSKPSASSIPSTNKMIESLEKIVYSGRIKSGKKTIGIIRFSDEEKMVQVGELIDIFTIDNITEDSIGLKYVKKIIYVKKNK